MVTWLGREATLPRRYGMSVIEQGKTGPSGPTRGGDAPPPQQTFFIFAPPQKPPCLPPARKLACRPAAALSPYRFHRFEARLGCDSLRGPARLRLQEPSRLPPPR